MLLSEAPVYKKAIIKNVIPSKSNYRMMEMGFVEGAEVTIIKKSLLGGPLIICLGDSKISMRSTDAKQINVSLV